MDGIGSRGEYVGTGGEPLQASQGRLAVGILPTKGPPAEDCFFFLYEVKLFHKIFFLNLV